MVVEAELGRALERAPNRATRVQYFAALLGREAGIDDLVVVGGSAIEILTLGGYASEDIDLVGSPSKLSRVLEAWGFEKASRVWFHKNLQLVVDIPSAHYHGSLERTTRVETPYGPIRLAASEDLIVSRLISAKYWRIPADFDQALLLAIETGPKLDWKYIRRRAKLELVTDLFEELQMRLPRLR